MSGEYNDLYPTPTRLRLLEAIADGQGRIYFEANHVWDDTFGVKVTNRVLEMIGADWVWAEKVTPQTTRPGELAQRTYYRLTELGESVLKERQR